MKNIAIALVLAAFVVPAAAHAEETSVARPKTEEASKKTGEVNTKAIVIVGRRQKPRVSVMVSRSEPKLSVTQSDVRLLPRMDAAVTKAPF